jgi:hypothetical protein
MQQFLHRGSPIQLDASHYNGFFMYWVGWLKISLSLNPNTKRSKYKSLWNKVVLNNSGYTDHSHHFAFDFLLVKNCPWTKFKCGFRFYVECRIGIYSLFLFRDNCWSKEIQKQKCWERPYTPRYTVSVTSLFLLSKCTDSNMKSYTKIFYIELRFFTEGM